MMKRNKATRENGIVWQMLWDLGIYKVTEMIKYIHNSGKILEEHSKKKQVLLIKLEENECKHH